MSNKLFLKYLIGFYIKVKLSLCLIFVIKHHAMKMYGSGGTAPPLLTSVLDGGKWPPSFSGRFTPGKQSPVSIEQEAGWAPDFVWRLWREKSLSLAGNRTPAPYGILHNETHVSESQNCYSMRTFPIILLPSIIVA
jgi:hypothetical protein